MEHKRTNIMPNDIGLHKPSGEKWVVAGVNYATREVVPYGYPFPSFGKMEDCEIVERRYELEFQPKKVISEFLSRGMPTFIDLRSAMFHGMLFEEDKDG